MSGFDRQINSDGDTLADNLADALWQIVAVLERIEARLEDIAGRVGRE